MEKQKISSAVINRLPAYLRLFTELEEKGVAHVSSSEISELMGTTASQVRQDFSNFGGFGRQGYGYDVRYLCEQMQQIMGLDKTYNVIIVGGGKIGQALANYQGFGRLGFFIKAVFDKEVWHIRVPSHIDVFDTDKLPEFCRENKIDIAIISVPKEAAMDVARMVRDAGVKGIWNFASQEIKLDGVHVENVHLNESLFLLTYKMNNEEL